MSVFLNYIFGINKELEEFKSEKYVKLYEPIFAEESEEKNEICLLLSTIHELILDNYRAMNERLPAKDDSNRHFWAEQSRHLKKAITLLFDLQEKTDETIFSFYIDEKYENIFRETLSFLEENGGSTIPIGTKKVELPWKIPIVIKKSVIEIKRDTFSVHPKLKHIGNGSYANVYSYKDDVYNEKFIVKKANKNLNTKELERFRNEFEIMNNLNSPYIVNVFTFDYEKNQYIMEHMDDTLYNYIQKNNDKLTNETRFSLAKQLLKAFRYIHKKNCLHRDISFTNILIKIYEDTLVLKVADFGLAKDHSKNITAKSTEFKGSLNDPMLNTIGWENYERIHELYPLTWVVAFILTGKEKLWKIEHKELKDFIKKGMCEKLDERFQDVDEMYSAIQELEKKLKRENEVVKMHNQHK